MAPGKVSEFYRQHGDWFCNAGLPSDIMVIVNGVNFHLHKFPLISKCGKLAKILEGSPSTHEGTVTIALEGFPCGPETFLLVAKFCYSVRVDFSPRNVVLIYCAADFLEMSNEYGERNLLSKSESFFHRSVLHSWKDCILALQSCETLMPSCERLQIISKSVHSLSMMACTDPSLFGWPMMMYGTLQSPGGSILWNGINTGARICSSESDWWFEDISYLNVGLFKKLIQTMQARGMRTENLAGAIMFYCRKYLPGLGRWQGGKGRKTRTVASFSLTPAAVDQRVLLETIVKLLPDKKGKSFCRFLLGLLRVALILGVNHAYQELLESRIGMQLELATMDGLLIPTYSDSDTLYNTDCVERIIGHFASSRRGIIRCSPTSLEPEEASQLRNVAKLIDNYLVEISSDVNLELGKFCSLADALPKSSRSTHDGLYRALDIFFKAHPWLSEEEREHLCSSIDYGKLSIDACAHASQNDRLPLRIVLQVLFFEQKQLRTALAGYLNALDSEGAPATNLANVVSQIVQRDGWVTVVRENQGLRTDMEKMRSRVEELEDEFGRMKQEMKKVAKSHGSPHSVVRRLGCRLRSQPSDGEPDVVDVMENTPRASAEQPQSFSRSRYRKSFSLF